MSDLDTIVIGAGLSGLSAARRLAQAGKSVLVLEARDRVGGRTLSHGLAGDTIDLGGQWVGPTQDRVLGLASELGIQTFPQFSEGRKVMIIDGKRSTYAGLIPKLGLLGLLETDITLRRLDAMARKVPVDAPWTAKRAREWDQISFRDWQDRHLHSADARALLDVVANAITACEPRELSFLYFLFYLHAGGGIRRLAEVRHGAQQDRLLGGAQQLSLRMAEDLNVRLSTPVSAVEQDEHGVKVHVHGETLAARRVILALPPALCARIEMELPTKRRQLQDAMPMGSVIKCVAAYERPFWRAAGLSGEAIAHTGPVRMAFDDCSDDGKLSALVGFIIGDSAREMSAAGPAVRRQAVLDSLAEMFGPEARQPIDYVDKDWIADPWSLGCYVGLMPPGVMTEMGAALRTPVGRIHFAGTETATKWAGYFDGAIQAGQRAAHEVSSHV